MAAHAGGGTPYKYLADHDLLVFICSYDGYSFTGSHYNKVMVFTESIWGLIKLNLTFIPLNTKDMITQNISFT